MMVMRRSWYSALMVAAMVTLSLAPMARALDPVDGQGTAYLAFGQIYALPVGAAGAATHVPHNTYVYDMAPARDGSLLYVADPSGVIVLSTATTKVVSRLLTTPAFNLHLAGPRLYVITQDPVAEGAELTNRKVVVIDVASGQAIREFQVPKYSASITVTPDESKVVVLDQTNNTVNVYAPNGELLRALNMFKATDAADPASNRDRRHDRLAPCTKAAVTPDGRTLWVVEVGGAKSPSTVWGIDLTTFATSWIDLRHPANVRGAALSPDGRHLYLSCIQHVSKIDLQEKREVLWVKTSSTVYGQGACLSNDGSTLFVCGSTTQSNPESGETKADGKLLEIGTEDLRVVRTQTVADFTPYLIVVAGR